jgi:miniconductance mechanosensitive channel
LDCHAKYDADGDVMSINFTVKVQTGIKQSLQFLLMLSITDSFKTGGMSNSGGRRINRAIYLKVSSFVFCDDQMLEQLKNIRL